MEWKKEVCTFYVDWNMDSLDSAEVVVGPRLGGHREVVPPFAITMYPSEVSVTLNMVPPNPSI